MYIIETRQLAKHYGGIHALDGIDLALEPGHIYGLVGNNGAGKTTLFRILAGLARPTSGSYALFGETTPRGRNKARKRTGFLIESPVYYANMSASSNLRNIQLLLGGGKKEAITATLEQVGLDPRSKQRLTNYSLGMKQRYGLAAALIGDPELLVLDEPLNGLDPSGAQEMNRLLKTLCANGKTILLSSHLLGSLYKTATDYIFMDHGKIIEQISQETLEDRCGFQMTIHTADMTRAEKLLRDVTPPLEITTDEDGIHLHHCGITAGEVTRALQREHIEAKVETSGVSLEDYFFGLLESHR